MPEKKVVGVSIITLISNQHCAEDEIGLEKIKIKDIFRNLYVRILNLFYSLIVFYYIFVLFNNNNYVLTINATLLFIIITENIYALIKRQGREYKWFSISVFSFSLMFIIYVWVSVYINKQKTNKLTNEDLNGILYLYVQIILIFLIILRCFSSFKSLTPQERAHSALLLLTGSTDCADLLNYITLKEISDNRFVINIILLVFSISIIQFSFSLTSVKDVDIKNFSTIEWCSRSRFQKFTDICFGTEIWSILVVMFTQDLPFFVVRVLLVFYFHLFSDMNFLIYIIKNGVLLIVDLYRIYYIFINLKKKEITPKLFEVTHFLK